MIFKKYYSYLSVVFHYIFFKIQTSGSNILTLNNCVLLWKSKIITKGNNNIIELKNNVKFENTVIRVKGNNNRIVIYENVKVYEFCEMLIEGDNCEIIIGRKTTIGSAHIFCGESNTSIKIGENCMISREVFMNTSDFHSILEKDSGLRINPPQDILIERNVWIGFNTTLNKGVTIAESSIVASRSVVPGKKFPPNVIIAGIPAKVIKEDITWSREKLPY